VEQVKLSKGHSSVLTRNQEATVSQTDALTRLTRGTLDRTSESAPSSAESATRRRSVSDLRE